ncbi:MAG TPA: transglutaminaseTgpA domain-containing protein [Trebonia sp.]|nr:transglutaminaseTgpA domain-containing protein [Trebonia sp.]
MASHRRTAAAAFAVVLASVSLYPVFTGISWFWAGCGAVAAVALAGTATRLRRLPVALIPPLQAVALLLYLNVAFSNARSLIHLLPTQASLAALWHIAGQGFAEASRYAPPAPGLRGMLLLAAAGIGITAALTDLIAVRLARAALAGLPLLLLFAEPFTLTVSRGFLGTTIVFCVSVAGYLALLSSESRDRIREWEHPDPAERDAPDTRPLAAAGRRVGFASIVLALCVPLFIPGLHTTRLFGGGQPGIGGSAHGGGFAVVGFPDPNTQLSQELHSSQASPVLTYSSTSDNPDYLQIYALDRLTPTGWQLFSQPESLVAVSPLLPAPPGLGASAPVTRVTTQVSVAANVGDDALGALPVPYPATAVSAKGTLRADRSTLMVFDSGVSLGGLTYSVTSLAGSPTSQQLSAAPPPPAAITAHDLAVPAAYDPLRALAQSVVRAAGAKTPFADALALQNWLAGGSFKYTLNAPSVTSAAGLTQFLKVTRQGYCQQFSFAMAVLARLLGIPSRVAYGFTSGTLQSTGNWQVTTHDAHAWPELYFQGYGWLRFEPTPSGAEGQGTAYAPGYSVAPVGPSTTGPARAAPSAGPSASTGGKGGHGVLPNQRLLAPLGGGTGPAVQAGTLSPWDMFGLVVAGLVVLAAAAPWCARRVIRLRRWHRGRARAATTGNAAGHGAGNAAVRDTAARDIAWAHAAWQELRDDLTDYGAGGRPSESPRAVASRVGARLSLAEPSLSALSRIAMAEERARYAPTPADGAGLRTDSATVRRAIADAAPRSVRWRARLLPASVLGPALDAIASAADLYRGARGTGAAATSRRLLSRVRSIRA